MEKYHKLARASTRAPVRNRTNVACPAQRTACRTPCPRVGLTSKGEVSSETGCISRLRQCSPFLVEAATRRLAILIKLNSGVRLQLSVTKSRTPRAVRIAYQIGHPGSRAPLLLMIQGSGCVPVMHVGSNWEETYSTLYNFLPFAARANLLSWRWKNPSLGMVGSEKPGTVVSRSAAFNKDFTAESWPAALITALTDARRLPWVDSRRTLVVGESPRVLSC